MKKISSFIISFLLLFFLALPVLAQSTNNYGLDESVKEIPAFEKKDGSIYTQSFLTTTAGDIIGIVLSFVGVLFFILIIVGGIQWMTAGGSEEKVKKAKTLITNAAIGLIIVLSAYAITNFIGSRLTP